MVVMGDENLIVVIDDKQCDPEEVCKALEAQGLRDVKPLPNLGIVTGVGDSSLIERLCKVDGVVKVRSEAKFQLPPLREDIPQ